MRRFPDTEVIAVLEAYIGTSLRWAGLGTIAQDLLVIDGVSKKRLRRQLDQLAKQGKLERRQERGERVQWAVPQ